MTDIRAPGTSTPSPALEANTPRQPLSDDTALRDSTTDEGPDRIESAPSARGLPGFPAGQTLAQGMSAPTGGLRLSAPASLPRNDSLLPESPSGAIVDETSYNANGGPEWVAEFQSNLSARFGDRTAGELATLEGAQLQAAFESFVSEIDSIANDVVRMPTESQQYLRAHAMFALREEVQSQFDALESNASFMEGYDNVTDAMAREFAVFANSLTNEDVMFHGVGYEEMIDPEHPFSAFDTEGLSRQDYNYFLTIDRFAPPSQSAVDANLAVFGEAAAANLPTEIGVISDPSMTFRGANRDGVAMIHPNNIFAKAGDDVGAQRDREAIEANELAHSAFASIFPDDAWSTETTRFGFVGEAFDGALPVPSNLQFNEAISDLVSITLGGQRALDDVLSRPEETRYAFSRALIDFALSAEDPPSVETYLRIATAIAQRGFSEGPNTAPVPVQPYEPRLDS